MNLYAYVDNDPLNALDLNGLWQVTISYYALLGGTITVGNTSGLSGQWSVGGFFGAGLGAKVNVDTSSSEPARPGLMGSILGSLGFGIKKVASVDAGMNGPLGMLPSGPSYAPVEFEASAQLYSLAIGGKASVDRRGRVEYSGLQDAYGASYGGHLSVGATYRWGGEQASVAPLPASTPTTLPTQPTSFTSPAPSIGQNFTPFGNDYPSSLPSIPSPIGAIK